MFELFRVPWADVELDDVREFLDGAGEEPLTWEAKADDERGRLHPGSIQKAICGLANQIGGYLIIGARWDKDAAGWTLPGIASPGDEARVWLGKIIRRLAPEPRTDVRPWTLEDGRLVAIVRVEPVAQPPCMTPDGRVFQRVSGETIPVTDPALMESLMRRGRDALGRAETFAEAGARAAVQTMRWAWPWEHALSIAFSLAPVGRETDDIASRLFVPSFEKALEEAIWGWFENRPPTTFEWQPRQASLGLLAHFEHKAGPNNAAAADRRTVWLAQGRWDGSVVVGVGMNAATAADTDIGLLRGLTYRACDQLVPLCQRLGGYGPAHLTMMIARPEALAHQEIAGVAAHFTPGETSIQRVLTLGGNTSSDLASLNRELERAAGYISYESSD